MTKIDCRILTSSLEPLPIKKDYRNPVYITSVINDEKEIDQKIIIKFISNELIAKEIICSKLGISLGLPTPDPFLVLIPKSNSSYLKEKNIPYQSFAFGSELKDYPSIRHVVYTKNDNSYNEHLEKWVEIVISSIFDELIYNEDRNIGNLLWVGKNKFELIDHELSLDIPKENRPSPTNFLFEYAYAEQLKKQYKNVEKLSNFIKKILKELSWLFSNNEWDYLKITDLANTIEEGLINRGNEIEHIFGKQIAERQREEKQSSMDY